MTDLSIADIGSLPRGEAEAAIRARVQTIYLGRERVLTRFLGRPKIYLSTQDIGFAGHVMMDGFWEMWLTQFFARLVKPGMTVMDVGANFGYYTILFGEAVGDTGRVIAVEPVPSTVELLRKSIDLNGHGGRTTLVAAALGREATGQVAMLVPQGEPKNATVVATQTPETIAVASTNVDTLAKSLDRLDLVKIDAEGAEVAILEGMQTTLDRLRPPLMLEFNAARYKDAPGFLAALRKRYRSVRELDYNAALVAVTDRDLLEKRRAEDRLLFLKSDA